MSGPDGPERQMFHFRVGVDKADNVAPVNLNFPVEVVYKNLQVTARLVAIGVYFDVRQGFGLIPLQKVKVWRSDVSNVENLARGLRLRSDIL
jgi:hypothetical protein